MAVPVPERRMEERQESRDVDRICNRKRDQSSTVDALPERCRKDGRWREQAAREGSIYIETDRQTQND